MAKAKARVVLHGRFGPGAHVRLVRVRDESVLRPGAADEVVDTGIVDEQGRVEFAKGVEAGARYFIVGQVNGQPLEVRARGRLEGDEDEVLGHAPVGAETRFFAGTDNDGNRRRVDPEPEAAVEVAEAQVAAAKRSDSEEAK